MKTTHPFIRPLAAALLVVGLLAGCASTTVSSTNQAESAGAAKADVSFPDPGSAWLKGGTFVDVEQLRRIGAGMTKNQTRELIGAPHFSEGLWGSTVWNYVFNFRIGAGDAFVTCQYQVVFSSGVSSAFYWKEPACADYLKPRVSEVVRSVSAVPLSTPERFKVGADALFVFDKAGREDILPEGRKQLDALVTQIQGKYKRLDNVTVVGHTDRLGADSYNLALSIARAATVRDYLVGRGLSQNVIRSMGVGKTQPLVQCADVSVRSELITCLQPNRRVEIDVQGER